MPAENILAEAAVIDPANERQLQDITATKGKLADYQEMPYFAAIRRAFASSPSWCLA